MENLVADVLREFAQPLVSHFNDVTWSTNDYSKQFVLKDPDSKVHGANMDSTWGRQDPGGVGHMGLTNYMNPGYFTLAATDLIP